MIGGRKTRSNKGKNRGAYGPRTGKTRSGARFRGVNSSGNRNRVNARRTPGSGRRTPPPPLPGLHYPFYLVQRVFLKYRSPEG